MGRKTNSVSLRLKNTNRDYNNCWYSDVLYSYNLSRSLKLDNYLSQTLKAIEIPCPQASVVGAYKKASVLVCYLDPKKRVRLLGKSSPGAQNRFPSFFSLTEKKQDKDFLNPQGTLDSNIFYQGAAASIASNYLTEASVFYEKKKNIKEKKGLQEEKPFSPAISFMREFFNNTRPFFNSAKKNNDLFSFSILKSSKYQPLKKKHKLFFFQGPLGLELSKKVLDTVTVDQYTNSQLTVEKQAIYDCNAFFPAFLKKLNPKNSISKIRASTPKSSVKSTLIPCLDGSNKSIYSSGHLWHTPDLRNFPHILAFPPKQYFKEKYISEKFYDTGSCTGINFPVGPKQYNQHLMDCFPEKFFLEAQAIAGISKSLSMICALYKNLSIYGSKKYYSTFSRQRRGNYKRLLLQRLLSAPACSFFFSGDSRKSWASTSWYSNFFLEKWKGEEISYCKDAFVCKKKIIVQKNIKNDFLTLYQFYHGFSRFWENAVQISFYKSTKETCCSLFLADTVAYLLEKKVDFRSIKRQLLLELNNKNKNSALFSFSKNNYPLVTYAPNGLPCPSGARRGMPFQGKVEHGKEKKKVTGIRISCSGRVGGRSKKAQRSRKDTFMWGETGLHVFSNQLDFAKTHAETPFGTVGVKVWVCTN